MTSLRRFSSLLALVLIVSAAPALAAQSQATEFSAGFESDLASLPASETYGAFVHFSGVGDDEQRALLADKGLRVTNTFPSVNVVFAVGEIGRLAKLAELPEVVYVEADKKLELLGDTGTWASRAKFVTERVGQGPYRTASGAPIDGSGVGVAVIDSGVDSTHPDLAERTAANYKVVCSTPGLINVNTGQCFGPHAFVPEPYTDASGGHGTHVAGIAVGDGTASDGTFEGVAPGASLYGYGVGEFDTMLWIAEAFQHIITNYDTFVPRIRVINNSYGDPGGSAYDANSVYSKLVKQVVAKGATVVFAAGNDGGNGSADMTSSFAKDPTPGVITAANYYDGETGTRNGALDDSSSRGRNGTPTTYPDLSAPGTSITSTCRPVMPICATGPTPEWAPNYATLTGTSMASPHIAGAAALLYQARPTLTPAQVEDVLQDTAHRFTGGGAYVSDPQNSGGLTSFDKGAGLLDVPAALNALGVGNTGYADPAAAQTIFAGDGGELPLPGEADIDRLTVQESATGLTYRLGLRDLADGAPLFPSFRLVQNVDGDAFTTTINMTASGPVAPASSTTNNAVATNVSVEGNDIVFFIPWANLGNPATGSAGHNVWVASYQGLLVDSAPGGTGPEQIANPRYGSYSIYR